MHNLDNNQLKFWKDNGFIVIEGFFDSEISSKISEWTAELMSWPESSDKWIQNFETNEKGRVLSRMENFLPSHMGLNSILNGPKAKAVISQLMGEEPVVFKDKLNVKPAFGKEYGPHQDIPAYKRFVSSVVTMAVPVDRATVESGCLQFVHNYKGGEVKHDNRGYIVSEINDRFHYINQPTEIGDVIFFNGLVPHGSPPNKTDRPRRIFFITFNPKSQGDHNKHYYSFKHANPNAPELNLATPFDPK